MKITSTDKEVQKILLKIENQIDLDKNMISEYFRIESGKWNDQHLCALISEIGDLKNHEVCDMKINSMQPHTSLDYHTIGAILHWEICQEAARRFQKRFEQK